MLRSEMIVIENSYLKYSRIGTVTQKCKGEHAKYLQNSSIDKIASEKYVRKIFVKRYQFLYSYFDKGVIVFLLRFPNQ